MIRAASRLRRAAGPALLMALALPAAAAADSAGQAAASPSAPPVLGEAAQRRILERTAILRLAPSLETLSPGERQAVGHLLAAGAIFQRLYEEARHPQASAVRGTLGDPGAPAALLYRLFQGPIATTLENERRPFVAVEPESPGKNVYPEGVTVAEVDDFLARWPARRGAILGERTVVRRATRENVERDLAAITRHPVVGALQPGLEAWLRDLLQGLQASHAASGRPPEPLYAVPHSVAWADEMVEAQRLLFAAAAAVEPEDGEFARYLRNRGRDLVSNDYESGDASWVRGRFGRLNAQIGAYETYDDALFGVKAFPSLSLLVRDEQATDELARALGGIQAVENALPYAMTPGVGPKRVREDIPVGVYDVVADFGQARGTNTATILPNDALFARRYGRTVLMRRNIIVHPDLAAAGERRFRAAVAPAHAGALEPQGGFQRTLWHEIGHYLGPDRTRDGQPLGVALRQWADALEEMKSDLVSLFANERFLGMGLVGAQRHAAVRASGILRTLQDQRPRADQPYQIMQLAQFNWFLERGLLRFDEDLRLVIDDARYPATVEALLGEVMALQAAGDPAGAESFFRRWTVWEEDRHGVLARRLREAGGPAFRLVRYAALGE